MYLPAYKIGALAPPRTLVMRSEFDNWKFNENSEKPVYNDPRCKPCKLQFTDLRKLIWLLDNLLMNTIAKSINTDGTNWHPICNLNRRSNTETELILPHHRWFFVNRFKGLCLEAEPRKLCHGYTKSQPPWEAILLEWSWFKNHTTFNKPMQYSVQTKSRLIATIFTLTISISSKLRTFFSTAP